MKPLAEALTFACLSTAFAGSAWAGGTGETVERSALKADATPYKAECPGCYAVQQPIEVDRRASTKRDQAPPFFQLSTGGQTLGDGATSLSAHVRGGLGAVGADAGFSSFFEESPKGEDFESLQLWNASVAVNLTGDIRTDVQMFMTVGIAGMTTALDDAQLGFEFGMDVRKPVGGFALLGSASGRLMGDNTAVFVGRAALSFSVFELGYRLTAFENGPKLGGPEVGLAWRY